MSSDVIGPIDAEAIAVEWLTDASNVDAEVATQLPASFTTFVRVFSVGGNPVDHLGRLVRARLQVDTWAPDGVEGKGQAFDLMVETLAALKLLEGEAVEGAFVTAVDFELMPLWSPDPESDRPRYIATLALTGHREPAGS